MNSDDKKPSLLGDSKRLPQLLSPGRGLRAGRLTVYPSAAGLNKSNLISWEIEKLEYSRPHYVLTIFGKQDHARVNSSEILAQLSSM